MNHYQPTLNSRERILLVGGAGTGKSYAAFSVARKIPGTAFVVDNDFSFERLVEMSDTPADQFTITDVQPDDWTALIEAVTQAVDRADRDDLLVIDSMTPTWQAVQDWYADEIFDKGLDEFFLDARKQMTGNKVEGFDGWKDWSVINKVYGRLYRLINRFPGHVILTAEAEPITADTDPEMKKIYGRRIKHRGQKSLPHKVSTILQTSKSRDGEYELTTIKDRGREAEYSFNEDVIQDFFMSYLVGCAGWTKGQRDEQ